MQLMNVTENLTMSSREIAELTGKQPQHVKRDIELMLSELGKDVSSFGRIYKDSMNRDQTEYVLPKDETICLVAGYNVQARMAIIKRWQELESNQPPMSLENLLKQNVVMIEQLSNKVVTLEHKIQSDKPMTEFGRAISESATAVMIGDWIKALADDGFKLGRNRAFKWFREKGYLNSRNAPYQRFVEQGLFEVKENLIVTSKGQKVTFTTLLTGKGQMIFGQKIRNEFLDLV